MPKNRREEHDNQGPAVLLLQQRLSVSDLVRFREAELEDENGVKVDPTPARPSRPLSCCRGLNQPRALDNGRVLAMLTALRVALVQRERVPLSIPSGRFPGAAHERTLTV
jgi:hypothetical protein